MPNRSILDIPIVKIYPLRRSLPTELLVGGLTTAVEKRNCLIQTIRSHRRDKGSLKEECALSSHPILCRRRSAAKLNEDGMKTIAALRLWETSSYKSSLSLIYDAMSENLRSDLPFCLGGAGLLLPC